MAAKSTGKNARAKKTTEVRNTPVPRKSSNAATTAVRQVTPELIARRAYEIYISGNGGNELDNWLRAERELKGQR